MPIILFKLLCSLLILSPLKVTQNLSADSPRGECVQYSMWYTAQCSGLYLHHCCNFGMSEIEKVRSRRGRRVFLTVFEKPRINRRHPPLDQVRDSKCLIGNKVLMKRCHGFFYCFLLTTIVVSSVQVYNFNRLWSQCHPLPVQVPQRGISEGGKSTLCKRVKGS